MSVNFMLAFFKALAIAGTGPIPIIAGSTPPWPVATISASGVKLCSFTASSDATNTKAAPSLIPEALPAVTVPSFLKAARKLPNFSSLVLRLMNSSASKIIVSLRDLISTGTISFLKWPASCAVIAFCWDAKANASCSSRVKLYLEAMFSAVIPMW